MLLSYWSPPGGLIIANKGKSTGEYPYHAQSSQLEKIFYYALAGSALNWKSRDLPGWPAVGWVTLDEPSFSGLHTVE